MSLNRVYSPYLGRYVLTSYAQLESVATVQRTLEPTPLVAKGSIEAHSFPDAADVGAEKSWNMTVHNIGDTGIFGLGIVNPSGNPGSIVITFQGTEHTIIPGYYLRIRTPGEVPNCTRIIASGTIKFLNKGSYTLKLWGMHLRDSTWYYDQEILIPVSVGDAPWPVTRRIHLFDSFKLKAEAWEVAKTETREITNVDMDALIGGKLEYTIHYTRGNEIELEARIFWNDTQMTRALLSWGKLKTGTIDLTGLIKNSNALRIWMETTPVTWAECSFDIWITLGYSKEPAVEPDVPEPEWWEKIEPWQWAMAGVFGLGVVYIAAVRPQPPQIITVPMPSIPYERIREAEEKLKEKGREVIERVRR